MFQYVLLTFTNLFLFNMIEWSLHKLAHVSKTGILYTSHKYHHIYFNSDNLEIENYDNLALHTDLYFGPPILCIYILYYFLLPYFYLFFFFFFIYMSGIYILHMNYHLKNSSLEKFEWFRLRKKEHLQHHIKLNKNLMVGPSNRFDKFMLCYDNKIKLF